MASPLLFFSAVLQKTSAAVFSITDWPDATAASWLLRCPIKAVPCTKPKQATAVNVGVFQRADSNAPAQ